MMHPQVKGSVFPIQTSVQMALQHEQPLHLSELEDSQETTAPLLIASLRQHPQLQARPLDL
jgi:hypothetical protein